MTNDTNTAMYDSSAELPKCLLAGRNRASGVEEACCLPFTHTNYEIALHCKLPAQSYGFVSIDNA